MSLAQSLKDKWNRLQCRMDGANVGLFTSVAVDNELKKDGWALSTQFFYTGVPMIMSAGAYPYTTITNPRGEKVSTVEQRREYLDARRAAAERVYNVK